MAFSYKITNKKDYCTVSLIGNLLDKHSAKGLLDEVENLIADGKKKFILDLSELQHINSNGLNVLIIILTKSRNSGGDVVVSHVPEKIKPLLVVTKLNTVFTVMENNKSAEGVLKTVDIKQK